MDRGEFDRLCDRAAKMDYVHIANTFPDDSKEFVGRLGEVLGDIKEAERTYSGFILMAVAADGILALEEFMLLRPLLEDISGYRIEYDDAVQLFMEKGFNDLDNFKKTLKDTKTLYAGLPDEMKDSFVRLCLKVCAVDGKISDDEKTWLSLIAVDGNVDDPSMWDRISEDVSRSK